MGSVGDNIFRFVLMTKGDRHIITAVTDEKKSRLFLLS